MVSKREVLKAAGAAAVHGMVPAATVIVAAEAAPPVARIPLPPDPIKECERLAAELARAMNAVRNGNYRITIRPHISEPPNSGSPILPEQRRSGYRPCRNPRRPKLRICGGCPLSRTGSLTRGCAVAACIERRQ